MLNISLAFNYSLIIAPLLTYHKKYLPNENSYINSNILFQNIFTIFSSIFLFLFFLILNKTDFFKNEINLTIIFIYFFSSHLQFFFRFLFIIKNKYKTLLIQNLIKYSILIIFLGQINIDSLNLSFIFLILINLVTIFFALIFFKNFFINFNFLKELFRKFFSHSKWLFYSNLFNSINYNLIFLSSGILINSTTLATMRIVQSIFNYVNIINLALESYLPKELGIIDNISFNQILKYVFYITLTLFLSYFFIAAFYIDIKNFFALEEKNIFVYFILFGFTSLLISLNTIMKIFIRSSNKTNIIFKSSLLSTIISIICFIPSYIFLNYLYAIFLLILVQLIIFIILIYEISKE